MHYDDQSRCDHDVHKWAGNGHGEFLPRLVGNAAQSGHPPDRQQSDVRCLNPKSAGCKSVPELVQKHACKKCENKKHALSCSAHAGDLIVAEPNPGQKKQEGYMNSHLNAGYRSNL